MTIQRLTGAVWDSHHDHTPIIALALCTTMLHP